MKMFIFLN